MFGSFKYIHLNIFVPRNYTKLHEIDIYVISQLINLNNIPVTFPPGTKHVDPDTGLIYFKYDFGYEFGIILPGEGKSVEIPVPKKTIIEPPKRTFDIEMPVYHEKSTQDTQNAPTPQFKPKKFVPSGKQPKWEPTSESEMSEYEGEAKKSGTHLQGSRWEPSSCSPVSLSPSLPSTSPAFNCSYGGTWCAAPHVNCFL